MSYIRTKEIPKDSGNFYLYLVKSERDKKDPSRVIQRYIAYRGRADGGGGGVKGGGAGLFNFLKEVRGKTPPSQKTRRGRTRKEPEVAETPIIEAPEEKKPKKERVSKPKFTPAVSEKEYVESRISPYKDALTKADRKKVEESLAKEYQEKIVNAELFTPARPPEKPKKEQKTKKEKLEPKAEVKKHARKPKEVKEQPSGVVAALEEIDNLVASQAGEITPEPVKSKKSTRKLSSEAKQGEVVSYKIAPQSLVKPFEEKKEELTIKSEEKPKPEPTVKKEQGYKLSKEMNKYIKTIENTAEKDYAQKYAHYLDTGDKKDEPQRGKLLADRAKELRAELYKINNPEPVTHKESPVSRAIEQLAAKAKAERKAESKVVYSEPIVTNAESVVVNAEPAVVNAEPIVVEVKKEKSESPKKKFDWIELKEQTHDETTGRAKNKKISPEQEARLRNLMEKLPEDLPLDNVKRIIITDHIPYKGGGTSGQAVYSEGIIKLHSKFADDDFTHEVAHIVHPEKGEKEIETLGQKVAAKMKKPAEVKPTPKEEVKPEAPNIKPQEKVKKGYVRLYRAERIGEHKTDLPFGAPEELSGQWVTDDPDLASWYYERLPAGKNLMFVDVPVEVAEKSKIANLPATHKAQVSKSPNKEYILPQDLADKSKRMSAYNLPEMPVTESVVTPEVKPEAPKQKPERKIIQPKETESHLRWYTEEGGSLQADAIENIRGKQNVIEVSKNIETGEWKWLVNDRQRGYSDYGTATSEQEAINKAANFWYNPKSVKLESEPEAPKEESKEEYIIKPTDNPEQAKTKAIKQQYKLTTTNEPLTIEKLKGFKTTTDVPYIDTALRKPEYYATQKGYRVYVTYMTPDEYRNASDTLQQVNKEESDRLINAELVNKYADQMKSGTDFDMPYLDYKDNDQEGRHRALAAKLAGIDKIPVAIVLPETASEVPKEEPKIEKTAEKPALKENPVTFMPQFKDYNTYIIKKEPDLFNISGFKYSVYSEDDKPLDISGDSAREAEMKLRRQKKVRTVIVKE